MNEMTTYATKDTQIIKAQLNALLDTETDAIAGLANASAYLNQIFDDINWIGFYILKENELVLGPFQGLVACSRIPLDKGVCGAAATTLTTMRIANVHDFKGHIACDSASNSELVCPLIHNKQLFGVLDIDSPSINRFDELDQSNMEMASKIIAEFYYTTMK